MLSKNVCLRKIRLVVLGISVDLDVAKGPFRIKIYDEHAC
jgi:hypothetical protein